MSPVSIFAAVLFLAVATRPAASQSQLAAACADGVKQCTDTLMGSMSGSAMPEGGPCGLLQSFVNCIMNIECPITKEQMDTIVKQASAPLAAQGIQCDIKTDGTGSSTGMGGTDGMEVDMSGLSKECSDAMAKCTKDYTESMTGEMDGGVCGVLKTYTDCINALPCPMDTDARANMVASIYTPLQKEGINCDADSGTMIHTGGAGAGGAGAGAGISGSGLGPIALFFQLQEKFSKVKCGSVPQECSKKHGGSSEDKPSCNEIKNTAQCMFSDCKAIQGTDDATASAELLVEFGKQFECSFSTAELQSNSSPVVVTGSLLVLMLSALLTLFFV